MSGFSLPAGFGLPGMTGAGTQGFSGGYNASTGGTPIPGSTAMVKDASGKDVPFDPATMASDTPQAPPPPGVPAWQQNWMSTGGINIRGKAIAGYDTGVGGSVPRTGTGTTTGGTTTGGTSSTSGSGTTTTGGTSSTSGAAPTYTPIPMNAAGGYNSPGQMGNFSVNDQYNPMTGSSAQVGTPMNTAPQIISKGIFSDGKGGYFAKDPSGKMMPLTGVALTAAKGMFDAQGYGAR